MPALSKRILIADDEQTSLLLMRATLEKAGFDVSTAPEGESALNQFHDQPFDMVMLDVEMPRLNGFQVLSTLRKEIGDDLPIIMVTGRDNTASVEEAYKCGATDFIAKPINWSLLGFRVKYLFRDYQNLLDLHAANARNTAILSTIPDLLFRINTSGLVLDTYKESKDNLTVLSGQPLFNSLPADVAEDLINEIKSAHHSKKVKNIGFTLKNSTNQIQHFETRIVSINEQEALCLVRDITEHKESEHRIYKLAYFDTLTGLPNRRSFLENLTQKIKDNDIHTPNGKLAVLFIGLDRFKVINDTLGYDSGDKLLQLATRRLIQGIQSNEIITAQKNSPHADLARPAGDEFIVLVHVNEANEPFAIAERIRKMMRQPFMLNGHNVVLTTSIGVATYPDNAKDAAVLLKHANTAMHHAKKNERDNCQLYNSLFTQQAQQRMSMENNLRAAINRQEFFLVYQPLFDITTGKILAVEALVRWHHPEQGIFPPLDFIPLAEENGLIIPIGKWVLQQACKDAATWQQAGHHIDLSVNLSAKQFKDPNLIQTVTNTLSSTGLTPKSLILEITENALMDDNETTLNILKNLQNHGIQIALDDFGTGYSSMSYLKNFPLNILKIDQSFVKGLPDDKDSLAIIPAIISIAKSLDYAIIAEGIETLGQAQILKQLDCDVLQGYYFSKPVVAEIVQKVFEKEWFIQEQPTPDSIPNTLNDVI